MLIEIMVSRFFLIKWRYFSNLQNNSGYNNSSNLGNPIYYSIININSSFMFINNQSEDLELIINDTKILDDEILNNEAPYWNSNNINNDPSSSSSDNNIDNNSIVLKLIIKDDNKK